MPEELVPPLPTESIGNAPIPGSEPPAAPMVAAHHIDPEAAASVRSLVEERFSAADKERSAFVTKWERWRKLLRCEQTITSAREGLNNIFDGVLMDIKETQVPLLMNAFFAEKPTFPLSPFGDEDVPLAQNLERFLQGQLDESSLNPETNHWVEIDNALGENWIGLGTFVAQISWDAKNKRPLLECGDIGDYLPDPMAVRRKGMRYVIRERFVTKDFVDQMVKEGFYDAERVKQAIAGKGSDTPNSTSMSQDKNVLNPTQDTSGEQILHDATYKLREYWEPDRLVHCLGESAEPVHDGNNPFDLKEIPIIFVSYIPLSTRGYGLGICEIGETIQYEINAKANQALDMVDFCLNPPFKKRRGANIEETVFSPGTIWEMDDIERDIQAFTIPNQLLGTKADRMDLYDNLNHRLGTTDYMKGIPGPDRVAQTVRLMLEQTSRRAIHQAKRFYETFIKWWYRWTLALNLQFLSDPSDQTWEQKMGGASPSPFKADPNTQQFPTLSTLMRDLALPASYLSGSKAVRVENFNSAVNAFLQDPLSAPYLNRPAIIRESFKLHDVSAPDRLLSVGPMDEQQQIVSENSNLALGQTIAPAPQENHMMHIQQHTNLAAEMQQGGAINAMPPALAEAAQRAIVAHIAGHTTLMEQMQQGNPLEQATQGGAQGAPIGPSRGPMGAQTMQVERSAEGEA